MSEDYCGEDWFSPVKTVSEKVYKSYGRHYYNNFILGCMLLYI